LNFVDGVGVIFAARHFKRVKIKERITGIDLFTEILKLAEKGGYSVFFLGSKEESIQRAIQNIEMNFPNLKIAGYSNGYFQNEDAVVEKIKNSKADILFVGMGSPKQEKFIYRNINKFGVKFV